MTASILGVFICKDLNIDQQGIVFIRPAKGGEEPDHVQEVSVRGIARPSRKTVYVRADLLAKDMIETLAHELRHCWQFDLRGSEENSKELEADAVDYGLQWRYRIPIPPRAELAVGPGAPQYGFGASLKMALPVSVELYYMDASHGLMYMQAERFSGDWLQRGRASIFGG